MNHIAPISKSRIHCKTILSGGCYPLTAQKDPFLQEPVVFLLYIYAKYLEATKGPCSECES